MRKIFSNFSLSRLDKIGNEEISQLLRNRVIQNAIAEQISNKTIRPVRRNEQREKTCLRNRKQVFSKSLETKIHRSSYHSKIWNEPNNTIKEAYVCSDVSTKYPTNWIIFDIWFFLMFNFFLVRVLRMFIHI